MKKPAPVDWPGTTEEWNEYQRLITRDRAAQVASKLREHKQRQIDAIEQAPDNRTAKALERLVVLVEQYNEKATDGNTTDISQTLSRTLEIFLQLPTIMASMEKAITDMSKSIERGRPNALKVERDLAGKIANIIVERE
jgi:hypothetical protein